MIDLVGNSALQGFSTTRLDAVELVPFRAGLDAEKLPEHAENDDVVARLDRETAAAAERGLFGSPSFVVGDELFFGNDRLDFVAAALTGANA